MIATTLIIMAVAAVAALLLASIESAAIAANDQRRDDLNRHYQACHREALRELPRRIAIIEAARDLAISRNLLVAAAYEADRLASVQARLARCIANGPMIAR